MSSFSQALKNYISTQGITIQALSKISGVERSFIQHMLTGKRVPSDMAVLEKIMQSMLLTPYQAQKLRHLYHMERIGQDVYKRHLLVKDLLESIDSLGEPGTGSVKLNYQHDFSSFQQTSVLYGVNEINRMMKAVIEAEASKDNGSIRLLIQPEHAFLIDLLLSVCGNSSLHIEHIFCLQKDIPVNSDNQCNLTLIKNVMPLLLTVSNYNAYISYDDLEVKYNETSIFPYFIMTTDKVIVLSYDMSYAALFLTGDMHQLYHTIYKNMFHASSPLMERIYNPMEFYNKYSILEAYPGVNGNLSPMTCCLFSQPCFMFFASEEQYNKYVYDFPMKDDLVKLMSNRSKSYYQLLSDGHEYTSYFTLEGLEDFWTSGRITEVPNEFYSPLGKQDCMVLMDKLSEAIHNMPYHAIMINPDEFKPSSSLVISVGGESHIFFLYIHPQKGTFHFVFHEKSIVYSIYSFLDYLKDSELVFSNKMSIEILDRKIQEFKNELK